MRSDGRKSVQNSLLSKNVVAGGKKMIPYAILLIGFLIIPAFTGNLYWLGVCIIIMYRMIGSAGLRTIFLSGYVSFAQGAFVALGAYCAGVLAKYFGLPPVVTILAGAVFATVVSVLIGLPFVRLRGTYYSMASMFFCVAIVNFIQIFKFTGSSRGLFMIPPLAGNITSTYYIFLALTVVSLAAMYRFEASRIGITLRAIAQSHDVASSIGINETFYRLLAIGFGSFFAGLAGAAFALYQTILSPMNYGMGFSIWFIMYMFIGGEQKFLGPLIGTIIFVLLPEIGRGIGAYAPYLSAAALLLVAYVFPGDITGLPELIKDRRMKRSGLNASRPGGGGSNGDT